MLHVSNDISLHVLRRLYTPLAIEQRYFLYEWNYYRLNPLNDPVSTHPLLPFQQFNWNTVQVKIM